MHSITIDAAGDDFEGSRPGSTAAGAVDRLVVERHANTVYRYARSLGADRELAADLTQEAFLIAWRKGKHALPPAAMATFLRRTARFLWLSTRTRERRTEAAISTVTERLWREESDRAEEPQAVGDELLAATKQCVDALEGRAARAIHLTYGDSRSRVETAHDLGLTPNGVRTLLARTRRWLEACIRRRLA